MKTKKIEGIEPQSPERNIRLTVAVYLATLEQPTPSQINLLGSLIKTDPYVKAVLVGVYS